MYLQSTFELSMTLDADRFRKLLSRAYGKTEELDNDRHVDKSLVSKVLVVTYRDSRYKKKVKLAVNPHLLLDDNELDKNNISKFIRKLEKRIEGYFDSKYTLDDFKLTGMVISTDIDVGSGEKVSDYIKVLQRVGKVKGFSPPSKSWLDDNLSFCLDGNSTRIEFWMYDLEGVLREQTEEPDKQLKTIVKKTAGLIRAEVRLTEFKAIHVYTDETDTAKQIADLLDKSKRVFLDTFTRIVPFGDFYKKAKATEIIRKEVTDVRLRHRMLRLLELIPEKKSLLLAQKALNHRKIDEVMEMFANIKVSPVTISKRHDIRKLDNLYKHMT
jgi:hypothetical protein